MNKFLKVLIAILGAVDVVFSIFIPIAVALLLVNISSLGEWRGAIVLGAGMTASLFRAVKVGFLKQNGRNE